MRPVVQAERRGDVAVPEYFRPVEQQTRRDVWRDIPEGGWSVLAAVGVPDDVGQIMEIRFDIGSRVVTAVSWGGDLVVEVR